MSTTLTPDSITSQYIFILLLLLLIGALTLTFLHFSPTSRSQKKQKGKTLLLAQPSAGKTQLAILLTTQSAKIKEKIPTITTVEDTFYEPRYWDTKAYSTLEKFRRAHPKEVLQNIVVIVHPTATDAIKCVAEILYDVLMQNRSSKLPILIVAHGHKGTRRKIEAELTMQQQARRSGEQLGGKEDTLTESDTVILDEMEVKIRIVEGDVFGADSDVRSKIVKWCRTSS